MSERMFKRLSIMGTLNCLIYLSCISVATDKTASGPEGIGFGLMAMVCLTMGVLLTGFGLNQLYAGLLKKSATKRTVIALVLAASPLLVWGISTAFRLKIRS